MELSAPLDLYLYAAHSIEADDIRTYAPGDPGYENYVREYVEILKSGRLPAELSFEITETIGLTRWSNAEKEHNPARFRRFRIFVNSVGLWFCISRNEDTDALPGNYFVVSLLDDFHALGDQQLLPSLLDAFTRFMGMSRIYSPEELPFFILGILLVKCRMGAPASELDVICADFLQEEMKHHGHRSDEFLWGCSFFNQLNAQWLFLVEKWLIAPLPSIANLRARLLDCSGNESGLH